MPRGRKGKRGANAGNGNGNGGGRPARHKEREETATANSSSGAAPGEAIGWVSDEKYDLELQLDKGYRKHLDRHGTKLLLRIRMLYYIQHDILADYMKQIGKPGVRAR